MSKRIPVIVVAAALVLAGGAAGKVAYGESAPFNGTPINWTAAGTITFVQLAFVDSGGVFQMPAGILVDAFVKGPPGNAQFKVAGIPAAQPIFPSAESPTTPHCGVFPELPYVSDDVVAIFEDQSMLFAALDEGWVCLGPPGAEFHLVITGGTGRFEEASGRFVGTFQGLSLGENASGALIAETGTIIGHIER